jgi:hypothetical protein
MLILAPPGRSRNTTLPAGPPGPVGEARKTTALTVAAISGVAAANPHTAINPAAMFLDMATLR